jgi:hypothetical protein
MSVEQIVHWRDNGGQLFYNEEELSPSFLIITIYLNTFWLVIIFVSKSLKI